MSVENPIHKLLFPTGNQAVIAAGNRPDALAVGQIGFFNVHTGLSVDGSVVADTRDIFIAVGTDPYGVGSVQDIDKNAGGSLQSRNVQAITVKGYVDTLPKIVEISNFSARCETDYAIKIEVINGQSLQLMGSNALVNTYNYRTKCCSDQCEPCASGDPAELAIGLAARINADPDKLFTATFFSNLAQATVSAGASADGNIIISVGGTPYTVAVSNGDSATVVAGKIVAAINANEDALHKASNAAAVMSFYPKKAAATPSGTVALTSAGGTSVALNTIVAFAKSNVSNATTFQTNYPGAGLNLRITSNPSAINAYGNINLKYYRNRATNLVVTLVEGFTCNGTVTTTQEPQEAEGKGYDLAWDEYMEGGWEGNPGVYRTSSIHGLERGTWINKASRSANYNVITIKEKNISHEGRDYENYRETYIAVPCADSTTLTGIIAVTDLIFTQHEALTNDVAAMDCTNGATSALTASTDGLSILSS